MKKIVLLCILFSTLFLMTGCGASVTSKTKFNKDGSGTRTISAEISGSDAKNLDGGFTELDQLLEEAAPEGISINRTMQENKQDAVYEFTFHFDNINEYNQKIYSITGNAHNATWYSSPSIFKSDVEFKEDDCTYELIDWAIKAFKNSKYSKFMNYFKTYEVTGNEVYYDEELMFSGTGDPSFIKKISPRVKKAVVYSSYGFDGTRQKVLEIDFEQGNLELINVDDVKVLLGAYSSDYKIDLANDKITYTLRNDEITQYLLSADLENKEENLSYEYVNTPFQKEYRIKESFSLEEFFSMFDMGYAYIYHYIKLPEKLTDTKALYTNDITGVEAIEGYDYAGAFRYDNVATVDITASQSVSLSSIQVNYTIDKELNCSRKVKMEYIKNGCNITEQQILKYYENIVDTISVADNGDTLKVEFTAKRKKEEGSVENSNFLLEKKSHINLRYIRYSLQDNIKIQSYFPNTEEDKLQFDQVEYTYQLLIEPEAGVESVSINGEEIKLQTSEDGYYYVSGTEGISTDMNVKIRIEQQYQLYYLWLIGIAFIIIIAILIVVLLKIKKNGTEKGGQDSSFINDVSEEEESEDSVYES